MKTSFWTRGKTGGRAWLSRILCAGLVCGLGHSAALAQQTGLATTDAPQASGDQAAAPKKWLNVDKWNLYGFVQSRFTDYTAASGDRGPERFEITRFRPTLTFDPTANFQFHVQIDMTTRNRPLYSVTGRDVYFDYHNAGYRFRVGQAKVPFGYEEYQEDDTRRATLERARVLTTIFPDERDIGVFFNTPSSPNSLAPVVMAALLNGNGINKYYSEIGKSFSARVLVPITHTQSVGASLFTGRSRRNSATFTERDKEAVGLEYEGQFRGLSAQSEFLWGRAYGHDLYGGYGQVAYAVRRDKATQLDDTVFVRYDIYDPNTDSGASKVMFNRTGIGAYHNIGHTRVTGEYDFVSNASKSGVTNTFGLQLQYVY